MQNKHHIIIQIYEIQTPSEAEILISSGVDHIGSVLISENNFKNPQIRDTIKITKQMNSTSALIPLFNNQDSVFQALEYYQPDIIHFCEALINSSGEVSSCQPLIRLQENIKNRFPEIKIMRSIPIAQSGRGEKISSLELAQRFEPVSDYFLTDTLLMNNSQQSLKHQPVSGFVGITGKICDWDIAAKLVKISRIPVILAGGIAPHNVFDGIMQVKPAGVDSCTGTNAVDSEGRPIRFKKDPDKIKRLVEIVRKAEQTMSLQMVKATS